MMMVFPYTHQIDYNFHLETTTSFNIQIMVYYFNNHHQLKNKQPPNYNKSQRVNKFKIHPKINSQNPFKFSSIMSQQNKQDCRLTNNRQLNLMKIMNSFLLSKKRIRTMLSMLTLMSFKDISTPVLVQVLKSMVVGQFYPRSQRNLKFQTNL